MNRNLLLGGAAVVGIFAALIVFRSPSTGDEVPDFQPPAQAEVADAPTPTRLNAPEGSRAVGDAVGPARPESVAMSERRLQNDAMLVGMESSAWTLIKREIARVENPASKGFMDEASDLIRALRDARLSPDSADVPALQARQKDIRDRMRAAGVTSGVIEDQFKRIDDLEQRYPLGASGPVPSNPLPVAPTGTLKSPPAPTETP